MSNELFLVANKLENASQETALNFISSYHACEDAVYTVELKVKRKRWTGQELGDAVGKHLEDIENARFIASNNGQNFFDEFSNNIQYINERIYPAVIEIQDGRFRDSSIWDITLVLTCLDGGNRNDFLKFDYLNDPVMKITDVREGAISKFDIMEIYAYLASKPFVEKVSNFQNEYYERQKEREKEQEIKEIAVRKTVNSDRNLYLVIGSINGYLSGLFLPLYLAVASVLTSFLMIKLVKYISKNKSG